MCNLKLKDTEILLKNKIECETSNHLRNSDYDMVFYEYQIDILGTEFLVHFIDDITVDEKRQALCYNRPGLNYIKIPARENRGDLTFIKHLIRHELIHAYLGAAGLDICSISTNKGWAKNEEMVDWFAYMIPKIEKSCEELYDVLLKALKEYDDDEE